MIGGGEGSQIGPTHRIAASVDGQFAFCAGALDVDAKKGQDFAVKLGIPPDRAYGDWQEMLASEKDRSDRLELITIATPNSTHFEITKSYLEAGFNILVEKPMTMSVAEAKQIVAIARQRDLICVVNYGYSGYPMVRQMRAMVESGKLGRIRLVKAEFSHGFHANAELVDNPRVRWRYDPEKAGPSAVFADTGIHALHLACFVSGQKAVRLSADFATTVKERKLEDDAMVNIEMSDGTLCRLWTSAIAIGRMHGLTIQVFGERGGLSWAQEQPNQLYYTTLDGNTQILERGAENLAEIAKRASRIAIGHSEGMPLAFANIYRDIAESIWAKSTGQKIKNELAVLPTCEDGLHSMEAIDAAVKSANNKSAWVEV